MQTPGRAVMNMIYRVPGLSERISDEKYLKFIYFLCFKRKLNLSNPVTFTEKLQWMKLYDRREIYTTMVDKYAVKEYVSKKIGKQYIIPTIGVWDNFEQINFDELPNQFVLKTTHDSGGIVICQDKGTFDIKSAKKKLDGCLKRNFFYLAREWPYKNVKPRIIAEPYITDENNQLNDYKLFCFSGKVKMLYVASDRGIDTRFDFFDQEFNHLPFENTHPNSDKKVVKPYGFEKMKELAESLSEGYPEMRVDFYDIDGKVYFGEITFFLMGGFVPFEPDEWDYTIGSWLNLPNRNGVVD